MKFSLFLGAGASMPLGFPDTRMFKKSLEESLEQTQDKLMLYILQKSGYEDIEHVLTAIEGLIDLPSNPGFDMINNTAKVVYEYMQTAPDYAPKSFAEAVKDFSAHKEKIRNYIYKKYSWKDSLQEELKLYDGVFSIIQQSDDGIHICTTNYDQVMEHYIDNTDGLTRFDGFTFNSAAYKSFFQPNNFFNVQQTSNSDKICHLYKLHGSLNWMPYKNEIQRCESNESFSGNNFVIYPTLLPKNKDYAREPHATIFEKFSERIEKTDVFIIIGYSFRDDLINGKFKEFLRREGTKMFVISPSAMEDTARLGDEFHYGGIDFLSNQLSDLAHDYNQSFEFSYDDVPPILSPGALRDRLYEYFKQLDISDNAKVYNLVGTLEEVDAADALYTITLISNLADNN